MFPKKIGVEHVFKPYIVFLQRLYNEILQDLSALVISSDEEAEHASSSSQIPPGLNMDVFVQAIKDFQSMKCFDLIRSNMFLLHGWTGIQDQINLTLKDPQEHYI